MGRVGTAAIVVASTLALCATVALATETVTYTYDAQGRLAVATHMGTVNNNVTVNYVHDPADNRVNLNVTGAP